MPSLKKPELHILVGRDKFAEDILRLLKNGSFNDIRIILEDGEILANKDVLSTRCEYFATMFSNNEVKFIEGETNSVDLSYCCSKVVMDKIIDYLFSGEMKFNDFNLEQLLSLMNMASLMLLDDVFVNVENFIIGWLPDSGVNCAFLPELISGLILAEQFKLEAIKDVIKLELHKSLKDIPHIPDIVKDSLTFKFLPYSLLKDILLYDKEENGFSPTTRQKFDAFVFWLSGNSCSEEEQKEIVDSFNFDDFTVEELLTEVRLSGLYSISNVSSKALKIIQKKDEEQQKKDEERQKKDEEMQKKDELISSQIKLINSTEALLSKKNQLIKQFEESESVGLGSDPLKPISELEKDIPYFFSSTIPSPAQLIRDLIDESKKQPLSRLLCKLQRRGLYPHIVAPIQDLHRANPKMDMFEIILTMNSVEL